MSGPVKIRNLGTVTLMECDGGGIHVLDIVSSFTVMSATDGSKESKDYGFTRVKYRNFFSPWRTSIIKQESSAAFFFITC
jgi:hypothetical protein